MKTLLKINLLVLFSGMFKKSRSAKKRSPVVTILIVLLAVYIIGDLFMVSGFTFYGLSGFLFSTGLGWFYFSLVGISIFALCFVGCIFAAQSQIFNAKDNELLLSLPIRPSSILTSRILSLLLLDYLFEAFIAIPAFVCWFLNGPVSVVGVIFFIISALLLPLGALAFATLVAWLIALMTSRMRNKNIVTLVLSLLFFFAYIIAASNISNLIQLLILRGAEIAATIQRYIFPAYHLGLAIDSGNVVSMLLFALCAIVPFVIAIAILSTNFIKIATTNRGAVKIQYRERALKVSGVRTAFVVKELRHFFSNPMYVLNTAIGGVFMMIGAVALVIKREVVLGMIQELNKTGLDISSAILICAALTAVASMNFVSAPSISLEGKNLWIAKSLPVNTFDILISKAIMHILVCGIPAVISAVICALTLQVSALQFVLLLSVPLMYTVLTALFGVTINLQFPRFDWLNEIQPIKQGVSTLLSMFGTMAIMTVLIIVYVFLLNGVMGAELYMLLCLVLFFLLSAGLYRYLKKGGSRRFETLNS